MSASLYIVKELRFTMNKDKLSADGKTTEYAILASTLKEAIEIVEASNGPREKMGDLIEITGAWKGSHITQVPTDKYRVIECTPKEQKEEL